MRIVMNMQNPGSKKSLLARMKGINFNVMDEIIVGIMFLASIIFIFCIMTSCTLSVNMMNSTGKASDMVDTDQKADGDVSPALSFPVGL